MGVGHNIFTTTVFESTYNLPLDGIIKEIKNLYDTTPSVKKSNVNGYQSRQDLHTFDFMKPIVDFICFESVNAFYEYGCPKDTITVESCWFNVNSQKNQFNQTHLHSGIVSGVFYLQAPEGSGKINLMNFGLNQLWQGHTEATIANSHNSFYVDIPATPGSLYLWPSYVPHSVEPNNTDVERISISFNLK